MNTVLKPRRVSLLISPMLPTVLSPTTPPPQPRHLLPSTLSSVRDRQPEDPVAGWRPRERFPRGSWPGLRTALAGSPVGVAESGSRCFTCFALHCYGPVVHLRQLPTPCCHDAVAFSHRRVNVPPGGDFHPAVWAPSQAHERGLAVRSTTGSVQRLWATNPRSEQPLGDAPHLPAASPLTFTRATGGAEMRPFTTSPSNPLLASSNPS